MRLTPWSSVWRCLAQAESHGVPRDCPGAPSQVCGAFYATGLAAEAQPRQFRPRLRGADELRAWNLRVI